jgi:hypothetical protein
MAKWFSDWYSVEEVIAKVAADFCESTNFKVLLDKIRTHPEQSKFRDQFISTAVECGKEKYDETKSAEKAIKYAMLYIAYSIAESDLAAKAHPDERTQNLSDILNDACFKCKVKITFSNLRNTLSNIVKFVSEKSIDIYNDGKETRRLAAEKERAEAEKELKNATEEKSRQNAVLIKQNSFEENVKHFLDGLSKVLPSSQPKSREHIKTIGKNIKIRAVLFLYMLLEILDAQKSTITKVDDFEKFFKQLFVAWLKGKNVTGYEKFTNWMTTNYSKINLAQLELLEVYDYLKEWDIEVALEVVKLKNLRLSTNATPAYTCPAWLLVNHITFEQVISVLATPNIFNDTPLLRYDGNTIVWSKENFNLFDKFYFQYATKPTSNSDDDDW